MEYGGVIVEPDMLRAIVRNSRCEWLNAAQSRAKCSVEHTRVDLLLDRAEAMEAANRVGDWQAATLDLVFRSQMFGRKELRSWATFGDARLQGM